MSRWMVSVAGRKYGPYTAAQMQGFAVEGRITGVSLISKDDQDHFLPASQDPGLGHLFHPAPAAISEARSSMSTSKVRAFGQNDTPQGEETAHFLILADMKSGSTATLEEEIFRLGPAYAVMPHAWILSSSLSAGPLRNMLIQKLGKLDTLLVIDATHDKFSWSNLGMEAETRIRRLWSKEPQRSAA